MALYGKFLFTQASNLLCARTCLARLYQSVPKNSLKSLRQDIFPLRPKKPGTAFFKFMQHLRPKLREEYPDMKQTDIVRKASKAWAELDPKEKELYLNEYKEKFRAYEEELKQYENSITDEQKQLWKEKKKERRGTVPEMDSKKRIEVLGRPKKPPTAFIMYAISRKRERDPNMVLPVWMQSLTVSWHALPAWEREEFLSQSKERLMQYMKDLLAWEMKMISLGYNDVVRRTTMRKYKSGKLEHSEES